MTKRHQEGDPIECPNCDGFGIVKIVTTGLWQALECQRCAGYGWIGYTAAHGEQVPGKEG
jgi:ribosomal protein L37AE/L43A